VHVQSKGSSVGAVKKKCKENALPRIIPEAVDEDELASNAKIAIDDDVASVHTAGVHCLADVGTAPPEVLAILENISYHISFAMAPLICSTGVGY